MSLSQTHQTGALQAVVGEPEVVEDGRATRRQADGHVETTQAWLALKDAAIALQGIQAQDGSVPGGLRPRRRARPRRDDRRVDPRTRALVPARRGVPRRERARLRALGGRRLRRARLLRLARGVPAAAAPGRRHPSPRRVPDVHAERVARTGTSRRCIVEVIWPEFIAQLETEYVNRLFVSLRLVDFTPGYDTNSAVLFPETVAMREIPTFTWGAIFQDREAARYRRVVRAASEITKLELPEEAARMLDDQALAEKTFVMWDIIHDRTHMRGDLPFDPFMIKQRMPYFLYSLEELRCDLTAFRECVAIHEASARTRRVRRDARRPLEAEMLEHARARAVRRDLRPDLPVRDHRHARAQLRRASAVSCCSRGCTSAACCTGPTRRSRSTGTRCRRRSSRWAMRSTSCTGARSTDRRWRTGSPRTSSCGARSRRTPPRTWARGLPDEVLAGLAEGLHRRGAGRRVPAVDVLRGAREEDAPGDRVDRGHPGPRDASGAPPSPSDAAQGGGEDA